MTMNKATSFLLLLLKLANCNVDVPRTNVNGVRDGSSSIASLLFVDLEKDAIRRITSSLQQSGRSINNVDRVLSQINGRQSLTDNGGRVTVVPARVDRLRLQSDFTNGVTLLATEPGLNPTQGHTDTARFFIPKNVKLPFITPLIHSHPGPFLTPPPRTASPTHTDSQSSHFLVTNSFSSENNRFVPNSQPTASPDPIFYFINNPTPFSTHVSSSQSTSSPNQIFHFVNQPTPPVNIPSQPQHASIGNNEINIPNIRKVVANILANNGVPVQQFDATNKFTENHDSKDIAQIPPEPSLNVQSLISNTLQPPRRNPHLEVKLQSTSISPQLNKLPPIDPLIHNQQIPIFNTQTQPINLNLPQKPSTHGVDTQTPLIPTVITHSSNNINPIQQQLTPPVLDLPKPEAQVQKPHCLLCALLNTNNTATTTKEPHLLEASSVHPNNNNSSRFTSNSQKPGLIEVSSLQPKDIRALSIIVDGVLFRADPPDIGIHSSELEDPGLFPHLKRPKEFIMIIPQSMLRNLGNDVNMNLIL